MAVVKTADFVEKGEAECPLRTVGRVVKTNYRRRSTKEIMKAIFVEIFSNFSLKG